MALLIMESPRRANARDRRQSGRHLCGVKLRHLAVSGREYDSGDAIGMLGVRPRVVMLPSRSRDAKLGLTTLVLSQDEFLAAGQSLTPLPGPRPRDHKPAEARTLSLEDFERP